MSIILYYIDFIDKMLAIVGSRNFANRLFFIERVDKWIESYGPIEYVISGGAVGTDTIAEDYARAYSIPLIVYKPDYNTHGRGAPLIRNSLIVENSTHVLAFPSRNGRGTQDTIRKARAKGKIVDVYFID